MNRMIVIVITAAMGPGKMVMQTIRCCTWITCMPPEMPNVDVSVTAEPQQQAADRKGIQRGGLGGSRARTCRSVGLVVMMRNWASKSRTTER